MSSSDSPSTPYANRINGDFSVGPIERNNKIFKPGERVQVHFSNGQYARGYMASLFRVDSDEDINLAIDALKVYPTGTVQSKGWTIATWVATRIERV